MRSICACATSTADTLPLRIARAVTTADHCQMGFDTLVLLSTAGTVARRPYAVESGGVMPACWADRSPASCRRDRIGSRRERRHAAAQAGAAGRAHGVAQ